MSNHETCPANDNWPYPWPKISANQFAECLDAVDRAVEALPDDRRRFGLMASDPEFRRLSDIMTRAVAAKGTTE